MLGQNYSPWGGLTLVKSMVDYLPYCCRKGVWGVFHTRRKQQQRQRDNMALFLITLLWFDNKLAINFLKSCLFVPWWQPMSALSLSYFVLSFLVWWVEERNDREALVGAWRSVRVNPLGHPSCVYLNYTVRCYLFSFQTPASFSTYGLAANSLQIVFKLKNFFKNMLYFHCMQKHVFPMSW